MLSHDDIIDKIEEFGHPINRPGMCFGIALMGLQAILLKDTATLKKRLNLLSEIPKGKLLETLKSAENRRAELHVTARKALQAEWHEQVKTTDEKIDFVKRLDPEKHPAYYQALSARLSAADKKLTERDLLLLSIPAYLEGIAIYFKAHPQLFENEYSVVVTDDEEAEEKKAEINQIILVPREDGSLKCKLISKGKIEQILISQDALKEELGKDSQEFYAVLKNKEPAKLKAYITNIVNILAKTDPLLKKDPRPNIQDALLTFPRVLPAALMEQKTKDVSTPAVQQIEKWSGIYDQKGLSHYFNVLGKKLDEYKVTEPVSFLLRSSNHTITVSWHPDQSWQLVDANQLWLFDRLMTGDELADKVLDGFITNEITTFATEAYAINTVAEQVKSAIHACQQDRDWQTIHAVNTKNVLAKDSFNISWLYTAAKGGYTETVKQLLEAKAEVDQANNGVTSLYMAAQNGHSETVKLLLKAKADVNLADNNGVTTLCSAALEGHIEIVKLLLEAKADVNQANSDGATPLYIAVLKQDGEIVTQLLEAKAGVDLATKKNGYTPLYIAMLAKNVHGEIIKQLLEAKAEVNLAEKDGTAPLYIAAANGHSEIVKLLLETKAEVNQRAGDDLDGATPLYIAVQKRNGEIVKQLLEAKAGVNLADNDGATPLYIAVQKQHSEIVKLLLEAKAEANQGADADLIPLCTAAFNGNLEVVKQLLKAKAGINLAENDGATPLFIAVQRGHAEVTNILLDQKGIDCEASAKQSVRPLFVFANANNKNRKSIVEALFHKKGINKTHLANFTPLHAAAFYGRLEVVKALLLKGANPNAVTDNNISAFEFAEIMGHTSICDLIKKAIAEQKPVIPQEESLLQKQSLLKEKKEAINDPDYLLLITSLNQMQGALKSDTNLIKQSEILLLQKVINTYEDAKGEIPIRACLTKVIEDVEMNRIYQAMAKNSDIFEVIKEEVNKKKGLS